MKTYVETRKQKIQETLNRNLLEPNRYLQAIRKGICLFKLEEVKKLEFIYNASLKIKDTNS